MISTNGKFYLGRIVDPASGQVTGQPLLYDPADLTTHAVVVGMTGSGKTGLCLDLLEEAALDGLPALMIDPKGDITNALLHFPSLAPQDFQPWVNPDEARREGKSVEQAAADAAAQWKQQLAAWDIPQERLQALQNSARFTVYTPGSDAGVPVSILASLKAPAIPWEGNREILREKITGTVTALLGLVGLQDIDPVRSREHILLSNIFEYAWSQGKDLDLGELILQTQNPPFPKLGVFDVNTFFPEKDRFDLAMLLNNILAAPAFQSWIEGQPLNIPSMLFSEDGQPRHSIFYIAHLSDTERMFFVTLLFSAVETWMRTQSGSATLRSIVYFDEIFGYLPPTANPPSKQPILRMLKQARAFGVGLVLVSQNPVDLDYKALSNAGTWFIGKLQTEQDKQRLLDGLQGAMAGNLDRGQYNQLISALEQREFLLHNVHSRGPQLFQSRWAMNYLAGPLTRVQIPWLQKLAGAGIDQPASSPANPQPETRTAPVNLAAAPALTPPAPPAAAAGPVSTGGPALTTTKPALPQGIREYFLPNRLTLTQAFKAAGRLFPPQAFDLGLVYRPVILAQADARFLNRKYNLDYELKRTALILAPDRRGMARWENYQADPVDPQSLDDSPAPGARFATLEAPFSDAKAMAAMQKDFLDWVYRNTSVAVHANQALKLFAGPELSEGTFRAQCAEAARAGRDAELQKASSGFDRKIEAVQIKLNKEERELSDDQTELNQRRMEEFGTGVENIFGLFGGRRSSRRLSTSLSKHRLSEKAKADVDESRDSIQQLRQQIGELVNEKQRAVDEINDRWGRMANQVEDITMTALKKDVLLDLFGVAWFPFHQVRIGDRVEELKGY